MRAGTRRRVPYSCAHSAGVIVIGMVFGGMTRSAFHDAMKFLVYGTPIAFVVGVRPGWRNAPTVPLIVRTFMIIGIAILMFQMSRLVGERTLRDIVLGRYHRPRTEERFFLFVDIIGSTPLAERIGPDAVHRFLGEVFRLTSDPIDDHRGEVYQYVGDEIVITWTVAEGRDGARPVACYFAIEQALARAAPEFEREFGAAPRLRAARCTPARSLRAKWEAVGARSSTTAR